MPNVNVREGPRLVSMPDRTAKGGELLARSCRDGEEPIVGPAAYEIEIDSKTHAVGADVVESRIQHAAGPADSPDVTGSKLWRGVLR